MGNGEKVRVGVIGAGSWAISNHIPVLAGRDDVDDGYARVDIESGHGVIVYGAVIDNATNDGTAISMKR